jgi:hypothetical protein
MAKKKAVEKKPRPISDKKRQPLKKKAVAKKEDKRLSRRKRSSLKRYDQTLSQSLYDELSILAKQAEVDLRAYVETCLRSAPAVRKHLKENDLELPDRPVRGNPATVKK